MMSLQHGSLSSTIFISGKAATIERLWQQFFSDPSQWWDTRFIKRNLKYPDFKHKYGKKALWIDNRFNPPWVHARLAAMVNCQQQERGRSSDSIVRMEQLWQEFFSDPSQWWDNRFINKKSSNYPDFEHKSTHEGLWIDGWLNPPWIEGKMAIITSGQLQSDARIRSRAPDSFCNDNLSKLCQEGRLKEALHVLELMLKQNTQAPINTYVVLLKGCAKRKALAEAKQVHTLIIQSGLDSDIFLGNTLVDMYAKCGSVLNARKVFNTMPQHNVFSWTAIISAYADHGQGEEAINLFQQMQQTGIAPDKVTFVVVLKACARTAALEQGKQLHSDIIKCGIESDVVIGNTLINMYAKCDCIKHARQVFNKMSERNVVSWNAMIAGYAQNGLGKEGLGLYEQMKQAGVQPNNVTYGILLKSCASSAALNHGKQLHSDIIRSGFEPDVVVGNTLVDMYAKCGCLEDARQVFNKMIEKDVVSWSAMIAGYVQNGLGKEALALYEQMKNEGVQPNSVTYVILLTSCASIAGLEQGKQLHSDIIRSCCESDVIVGNALVDMYAKCGCIEHARKVFNEMIERDVVSWNSMIAGYAKCGCIDDALELFNNMNERNVVSWSAIIAGYAQNGLGEEALALYDQMKQEGVLPNNVTYVILLNACASIAAVKRGKQLHTDIIRSGFQQDVTVGNTLVDMYVKCGCIEHAHEVFNNMNERDVVSWSTMIAAYAQNGLGKEAMSLYEQMRQEGVQPNSVTYVILLKTCASNLALEWGRQLHLDVIRSGCKSDVSVGTTLVDMYAKCGCIEHACRVFNNMHERDVLSWNVMISGHAQQGLGREALTLLEGMQSEGMIPNAITYVSVLSACSHCGLVDEGRHLFDSMFEDYGVIPTMDHYACIVDLLGRAGCLADAEDFINRMPMQPNVVVWRTLLGAAQHHGHVEIGRHAFDCVMKVEPENDAAYVLLSNTYAAVGQDG
ncbi:hypothetical protein O6H91_10G001200 [Diphasiastrum complanatum]|uniref:Uncharacterized protein n=1 Tax=Diphasiastrum complanatum TaxID=34168 RepID=A0ACC2CDH1_DIPCM|nr:hypothetical protein O6H91_10G001200 [Diphasiastrum complanatum]